MWPVGVSKVQETQLSANYKVMFSLEEAALESSLSESCPQLRDVMNTVYLKQPELSCLYTVEVSTKLQSCDSSAVLKLVLSQSNPPNVTYEGDLNTPYYCLATAATSNGPFDTLQGQLHILHVLACVCVSVPLIGIFVV